jgi:hypothetical protein
LAVKTLHGQRDSPYARGPPRKDAAQQRDRPLMARRPQPGRAEGRSGEDAFIALGSNTLQ